MVLVSLITWAARKSLHKQDYSFDERVEEASARSGSIFNLTRPQQYWFLGFKDRNLEARFLDDLARVSQPRTILGLTMALLMVVVGRLMQDGTLYVIQKRFGEDDSLDWDYEYYFITSALAILVFGLGLVATLVIMKRESFQQKRVVLAIVEASFFLYTVIVSVDVCLNISEWNSYEDNKPLYWWLFMSFYELFPYTCLFFQNLPGYQIAGNMFLLGLIVYVIAPLNNDIIGDQKDVVQQRCRGELVLYKDPLNSDPEGEQLCMTLLEFEQWIWPPLIVGLAGFALLIVSFIIEQANRRAFFTKCCLDALNRKQRKDQEDLLYSIFPKDVARQLIEKQSSEKKEGTAKDELKISQSLDILLSSSSTALFRQKTVAQMHQNVTILFTDIVGFTAMSQTCLPYEVMQFLHNLFLGFDSLVDLDPLLWKVETIGDA
eukprot:CAMPEP_0197488860 /NCGR_PEP_ID=MMETSP1311-20131121/3767_1 /TAXON_ID=464262 /ORGANISM="Genus nov. species nov., Strain RCC856" /LENGTH=432 /DNA_ID=CAMNT_0043033047 /DNA_START=19 /DNA_END=1313 /DNA_ORIENTATION=+